MSTVFTIMRPQLGEEKNRSNHSNPTHSLPQMPRLALKSRKAIWMPYMGPYLYTMVMTTGISSKRYSCQFSFSRSFSGLRCAGAGALPGFALAAAGALLMRSPPFWLQRWVTDGAGTVRGRSVNRFTLSVKSKYHVPAPASIEIS